MPSATSPFYSLISGSTSTTGANGSTAKKDIPVTVSTANSNMPVTGHTLIGVVKMAGGGVLDTSGTAPATAPIVDPRNTWNIAVVGTSTNANIAIVWCEVTTPYVSGDTITAYSTVSAAYNSFCIIDIAATVTLDGTPASEHQSAGNNDEGTAAKITANSGLDYVVGGLVTGGATGSGVISVVNTAAGSTGASSVNGWTLRGAIGSADQNCAIAELLYPSTTANSQAQWSFTGPSSTDSTAIAAFSITPVSDTPPVAVPGTSATVSVETTASLNGSGSYATTYGYSISNYSWSFVSRPTGSTATLTGATTATPSFVPDKNGPYVIQLIVTDSHGTSSSAATVTITAASTVRRYWDGSEAVMMRITTLLPGGTFA